MQHKDEYNDLRKSNKKMNALYLYSLSLLTIIVDTLLKGIFEPSPLYNTFVCQWKKFLLLISALSTLN